MQKSICLLFIFTVLVMCRKDSHAQYDEKDFVHYTMEDGLSDNTITCIQQDAAGYIWIGATIGLNRFDGYTFTNFLRSSETLPLLSNHIRSIKRLKNNSLAIISLGGFQHLNTQNFELINYVIPDSTAFSVQHNAAWDVEEMPDGQFAVSTATGFYVFARDGKMTFYYDAYTLKDVSQKRILYARDIFDVGKDEYLVFLEKNKLGFYSHDNNSFRELKSSEKKWIDFYPRKKSGEEKG